MPGDISPKPIFWAALAIAAAVALVTAFVFVLLRRWDTPPNISRVTRPYEWRIPAPVLQSAPQPDLAAYREEKQRLLDSPQWLDAQRSVARIALSDAMAMLAASAPPAQREGRR